MQPGVSCHRESVERAVEPTPAHRNAKTRFDEETNSLVHAVVEKSLQGSLQVGGALLHRR